MAKTSKVVSGGTRRRKGSGTPKNHGGRPRRDHKPGERVQLSLRVTPAVKRQLEADAEHSGRSLSQEAELRLEQSFTTDALFRRIEAVSHEIIIDLAENLVGRNSKDGSPIVLGCQCPAGADKTCSGPMCPRRPVRVG